MTEALWSVDDLAAWMKVPKSSIYDFVYRRAETRMPYYKLGSRLRFDPESIREWVNAQAQGGRDE